MRENVELLVVKPLGHGLRVVHRRVVVGDGDVFESVQMVSRVDFVPPGHADEL